MGLMGRQKQTEGGIPCVVHEPEAVAVEGAGLVALPSLPLPVITVDPPVKVVGVEIVAAPELKAEPVPSLGDIVLAPDLRE